MSVQFLRHPDIRRANEATSEDLALLIAQQAQEGVANQARRVVVKRSSGLTDTQKDQIWNIFQENMYNFYVNSSFGWDPPSKRNELFHDLSRFILIYPPAPTAASTTPPSDSDSILAYCMFRFEREYRRNELYCYELQVSSQAKRTGLGRALIEYLDVIGQSFNMQHLMLTVLKANNDATAFYDRQRFTIDSTSPDYLSDDPDSEDEAEDVDYSILSRQIGLR